MNCSFSKINLLSLENEVLKIDDNTPNELSEIMSKYNSDKGYGLCTNFILHNKYPPNTVCHNYTYVYSKLFSEYRNDKIKIFEMGVGVPSCMGPGSWAGSLLGWKEYFPNSVIFSADIDKDFLYCDDRITSYYADQENSNSINDLWKNMEEHDFDIIVDDGPHTFLSNLLFYQNSIHKLKTNGIFIIEDISTDFIDLLFDSVTSYNKINNIEFDIVKLIIPWPKKFSHCEERILKMNNLIIIQKL